MMTKRVHQASKGVASLVLALGFSFGAVALADDGRGSDLPDDEIPVPTAPEGVSVREFAYAGTGCPAGSLHGDLPVEGTTFVIGWEAFVAEVGAGIPLAQSRKNCQINLDLAYPAGWQYAVKSLSYGGALAVGSGVSSNVGSAFYFQGETETTRFAHEGEGPLVEDFAALDVVEDEALVWSNCEATRSLNVNVQARLSGPAGAAGLVRFGEDAAGAVPSVLTLVWRQCE